MTGPKKKKATLKQTSLLYNRVSAPYEGEGSADGVIKSLKELPQGQVDIVFLGVCHVPLCPGYSPHSLPQYSGPGSP